MLLETRLVNRSMAVKNRKRFTNVDAVECLPKKGGYDCVIIDNFTRNTIKDVRVLRLEDSLMDTATVHMGDTHRYEFSVDSTVCEVGSMNSESAIRCRPE